MYTKYRNRRAVFDSLAAFAMLRNQIQNQDRTDEADYDSDCSDDSDFLSNDFSDLNDQDEQWLNKFIELVRFTQDDDGTKKDQSGIENTVDTDEKEEDLIKKLLRFGLQNEEEKNNDVKSLGELLGDENGDPEKEKHQDGKNEEKIKTNEKEGMPDDIKRFLRLTASQLSDDTLNDMQALQAVFTVLDRLVCQASDQQRAVIAGMMTKLGYPDFILNKLRLTLYLETLGTSSTSLISDVTLTCMSILWNCCCVQQEFVQELAEEGGIRFMTNILKSDKCYGATNYMFRKEVKRHALHILYNMSKEVNLIPKFRMANTSQAVVKSVKLENHTEGSDETPSVDLKNLLDILPEQQLEENNDATSDEDVQNVGQTSVVAEVMLDGDEEIIAACLMLAYLADDSNVEGGKEIQEDKTPAIDYASTVENIVQWLAHAQKSSEGRFRGFSTLELTQGLTKLAVSNRNATQIMQSTACVLGVLLELLQHDDPTFQAASAECLWNLAFDAEARKAIAGNEALVKALESLSKDSTDKEVKHNAEGALWMIRGKNASPEVINNKFEYDIFISYAWEDKELVRQIHDSLRAKQYKIWIDKDCMSNDLLQSMSEAVEKSAVVFICMSEGYKHSVACRTEAEYTYACRKEFIPLMMQSRYKPTEWLGALLGTRLFFDFGGKYAYEKKFKELLSELDRKLSSLSGQNASNTAELPKGGTRQRPTTLEDDDPFAKLSRRQVQQLLKSKGIRQHALLNEIDGELLKQLKIIRDYDYYKFPTLMKAEYGMDLNEVLKLCAAFETLEKSSVV